jgi:hypothetical protein
MSLYRNAVIRARGQLAALLINPKTPNVEDWPCTNPADQECLQKAYTALQDAITDGDYLADCQARADCGPRAR